MGGNNENGRLEYNENAELFYIYKDKKYSLTSHPYEPCLYIKNGTEIVCILHNAFDTDTLIDAFSYGGKVAAMDGSKHNEQDFCGILAAAVDSGRTEMDLTFAAQMTKPDGGVKKRL